MFSPIESIDSARPRFEFYPLDSTKLQTIEIDKFPFIIGRSASASFKIISTSVSREHAEVLRTPAGFCIRDLGSTNGTSVNGRRVRETPLVDGDSVTIADVELTFIHTSMGRLQRTLTKPLPRKKSVTVLPGTSPELVATRTLSEALLFQAIPLKWYYIVDHTNSELLMTFTRVMPPLAELIAQADAKLPTKVASRLELLGWRLAAEQIDNHSITGGMLLNVTQLESLDVWLVDAIDEVIDSLKSPRSIGMILNWEWATSTPDTLRLLSRLRERGITIVYDDFTGGGGCIESMDLAQPDYLVLSNKVVRAVAEQPRRLKRLEIVHAACIAQKMEVVLPAGISAEDRRACCELGIRVAQQTEAPIESSELLSAAST